MGLIGYYGYPPYRVIEKYKKMYKGELIDLDVDYGNPSSSCLPDNTCQIIKNIINNAFALKDRLQIVIASVGKEKCDSGSWAAKILIEAGLNVIEVENDKNNQLMRKIVISSSNLNLRQKVIKIMDLVANPKSYREDYRQCTPSFGFWGVPPNDLRILDIFPEQTHLFGWMRCVEASRPSDMELEMYLPENLKTVFFSQVFCPKQTIARYLAEKYNGLFIDSDNIASNSTLSKIEAFLRL